MGRELDFFTKIHEATNRDVISRMTLEKPLCMKIAKQYGQEFWDGDRKFGYGGYKYIPGRLSGAARAFIDQYGLTSSSKILDVGCGKGFLLYEIQRAVPGIKIFGFDVSSYALDNAHPQLDAELLVHDAASHFPYADDFFDLVISIATLHNLRIAGLKNALQEIERVSRSGKYIMVEGYRDEKELFNLECWALTAESFFHKDEWIWIFNEFGYVGDYEFIYF